VNRLVRFGVAASLLLLAVRGEAHKPITSKYTYNEDVFPIVNARCGKCHLPGGIAPMSLLTYKDAIPWAESMRLELTADHMPPWYAENDPHRLSPLELDTLLTWATGGTPEGPAKKLSATANKSVWKLGKPDLLLPMPSTFTLGPDTMEATHDVLLQNAPASNRWIRAVDIAPGTAAVVRDLTIYTKSAEAEKTVAFWLPGDEPSVAPANAGFLWPAGAELHARIHYKKTWTYDGKSVSDRTSVGLYLLSRPPSHEMQAWNSAPHSAVLQHDVEVVAVRLDGGVADRMVDVGANEPAGSHVDLMHLLSRPEWNRWYKLPVPVKLAKGSRIDIDGEPNIHAWLELVNQ